MSAAVLVGYFAKGTAIAEGWRCAEHVTEICSVSSHCIAPAPDGWIDRWLHNELGFFNTRADARSVSPEGSLFAYRLLPVVFRKGEAEHLVIGQDAIEPLPPTFQTLGFDVVSKSITPFFECSPLSCNGLAAEIPVNRYCLVDTEAEAVTLAERFSREEPEPGPYYVLEVLRSAGH